MDQWMESFSNNHRGELYAVRKGQCLMEGWVKVPTFNQHKAKKTSSHRNSTRALKGDAKRTPKSNHRVKKRMAPKPEKRPCSLSLLSLSLLLSLTILRSLLFLLTLTTNQDLLLPLGPVHRGCR